jgi:transposase
MAAPLKAYTKKEQRSVIRILVSDGVKPIEIHRRMELQYGNACLSLQQVYEWSRKFENGLSSVADAPRRGQAHRVVTPQAISEIERVIRENRRVMVDEVATMLDISHGSAHHIIHDVLQFHKVSARWCN